MPEIVFRTKAHSGTWSIFDILQRRSRSCQLHLSKRSQVTE